MTTMTRQHFALIAGTVQDGLDAAHKLDASSLEVAAAVWAVERTAHAFANNLRATNPNFNRERFLRACGVEQ